MPTGVHIRDARQQLFDAAERILLRTGPEALTSRAVTDEAGVAKGVLHRHFTDFDAFLAELVHDRAARLDSQAAALIGSAGLGDVEATLTEALTTLFSPVVVALLPLITFRDELRARLRRDRAAGGIPILTEATTMFSAYLAAESEMGRIAADTDANSLALALVGGAHLQFADRTTPPPDTHAVRGMVAVVMADVVQRRLL
ncbi:MAG TPA: TetR/AcrR family transcriptional regulator [Sporichthyaceae bacterium]|jgi:AcrR family transcriptional regulator